MPIEKSVFLVARKGSRKFEVLLQLRQLRAMCLDAAQKGAIKLRGMPAKMLICSDFLWVFLNTYGGMFFACRQRVVG